jgi:methionine-rich copper-binding protein CopC
MKRHILFSVSTISIIAVCLIFASPAHAQPEMLDAAPAPDSVLSTPPDKVLLTFDRALRDEGTTIRVTNEQHERVESGDAVIDASNRFKVHVSLPALDEGRYTVTYTAASVGSSTVAVGSYTFTVDLPPARLELLSPVNGEAYPAGGVIALEMRVEFFDLTEPNNHIRIYLNGEKHADVQTDTYQLNDLSPGVHQISTVLVQGDDTELAETAIDVTIAVARPDYELQGWAQAALMAPDAGLQLTPAQLIGLVILTAALLLTGLWLGKRDEPPPAQLS